MRHGKILGLFVIIMIVIGLVSCSATPTRRSFKEGWKDSVVSTKVKYKMMKDKLVHKRGINVDVWRGVVTMTGHVTSQEERERAEQLAWQVKGVRGVDNFLKIVDAAEYSTGEAVVLKTPPATKTRGKVLEEKIEETKIKADVITVKKEEAAPKKAPITHPFQLSGVEKPSAGESKVSRRVEGPVYFEQDLSDEDRLARDAAEELKKLKGEDESY